MEANKTFTAADKRPFIKVIEFLSKQIIINQSKKYKLKMKIDLFTPYAVDKQLFRDLLDGVLHSLDDSINFPGRVKKNSLVESSTPDIFYHLVDSIPSSIKNHLLSFDQLSQRKLIFKVFQDLLLHTHNMSPVKLYLLKYISQEELSIDTEPESINTFMKILDYYMQVVQALSTLVDIHRTILKWSEVMFKLKEAINRAPNHEEVRQGVGKLMTVYAE